MLDVDGSKKSGSGTILRLAIALAAITRQRLHITNIRQNRPQPGLKYQHLEAVLTAAKLCDAKVEGAKLGSRELWFVPQTIKGGIIQTAIETAGSIPILFLATLPICLFAEDKVCLCITKGGTDTIYAPAINYLRIVVLPTLRQMGIRADINVEKYGYYPRGMGKATMIVKPNHSLKPIRMEKFGVLSDIKGVSICTFLSDKQVAYRQAKAAKDTLLQEGYLTEIDVINDQSNQIQKGSSIVLRAQTNSGIILGADSIGELRKTAEEVGRKAARNLLTELSFRPTVDVYLADMLIPYMALAKGKSVFYTREITEHIESNIWLMEEILRTKFTIQRVNNLYRIEKS